MRRRRDPIPRVRDAWTWLGGTALLGFLGAGVVAAAVALWENIDIERLMPQLAAAAAPLPAPEPSAPPAHADVAFSAVLFDSPRNRAYFPDASYYETALSGWETLVRASGGVVRRVGAASEIRALTPSDLLLLPEAPCLTDAERAAVRTHLERGGSLVANWAVGARTGDCAWRGWGTVAEITGADDVREIPDREGLFLTVPGGIALSAGLAPGTRIELRPEPSLALRIRGPRVYWSDWALNPRPDETGARADVAAVATRSPAGGRVTWLGLRIAQGATPTDSLHLARLAQNGILWAAGVPFASSAAWPGARRAGLVVALDVEDEPRNALATAEVLRDRGVPGSFFVVSQLVEGDDELASALASAGEVGSQTTDHTPVAGLTRQDQAIRLRRSWSDVERWTGLGPRGLHPPAERFDAETLSAWADAGGSYLLATNEARSASPEVHHVGEARVVVLPRLLKDDYNIIVQDRVLRSASLSQAWLADLAKQRAIGGLAVVAGHTQIMRPGGRIQALAAVLDSARAEGDWWVARASDVAEWWSARGEVRLAFEPSRVAAGAGIVPSGLPDLTVTGPETSALSELWIDVVLPDAARPPIALVDGSSVAFVASAWGVRVPVGPLPAGGSRRISFVHLDEDP